MKVDILWGLVTFVKRYPFEIEIDGKKYSGTYIWRNEDIGIDHDIIWDSEVPEIDEGELIELIEEEIEKEEEE